MGRDSRQKLAVTVAAISGQYHFVDEEGWQVEWVTRAPREWWRKRLWLLAGGHSQDGAEPRFS